MKKVLKDRMKDVLCLIVKQKQEQWMYYPIEGIHFMLEAVFMCHFNKFTPFSLFSYTQMYT